MHVTQWMSWRQSRSAHLKLTVAFVLLALLPDMDFKDEDEVDGHISANDWTGGAQ